MELLAFYIPLILQQLFYWNFRKHVVVTFDRPINEILPLKRKRHIINVWDEYIQILFSQKKIACMKNKNEMGIFIAYLLYSRNTFDLCHFQYES